MFHDDSYLCLIFLQMCPTTSLHKIRVPESWAKFLRRHRNGLAESPHPQDGTRGVISLHPEAEPFLAIGPALSLGP